MLSYLALISMDMMCMSQNQMLFPRNKNASIENCGQPLTHNCTWAQGRQATICEILTGYTCDELVFCCRCVCQCYSRISTKCINDFRTILSLSLVHHTTCWRHWKCTVTLTSMYISSRWYYNNLSVCGT